MNELILMADPEVARIPVLECGEPLVDLGRHPLLRIDPRKADPAGRWHHLRAGVADRLVAAAQTLPSGLWFLCIEGYRHPARQERYFARYRAQLAAEYPDLPPAQLHRLTSRFVSPPQIAPHSAGAAIDLTLCRDDGTELDMGTAVDATPEESAGACYTAATTITPRQRANRGILITALTGAGLTNYPTEWWHWSYGDRYWAMQQKQPSAVYATT